MFTVTNIDVKILNKEFIKEKAMNYTFFNFNKKIVFYYSTLECESLSEMIYKKEIPILTKN